MDAFGHLLQDLEQKREEACALRLLLNDAFLQIRYTGQSGVLTLKLPVGEQIATKATNP
eukprot:CAMPEP_0172858500 /NCGR_PEP_ID=MMETSP1075-20121228/67002_1 /TAXON_ID=2916 /ORGANISM="Ceratium fusus, Strain PA161109" /LENGTH=58 /DNA_ID=CAMNT_0013706067 /DNA_START=10 /DNA_END=184 /DNA_ORIENTATION=+